jgi:serine/threonine-protein kinase
MTWLSDRTLRRLREAAEAPDLSATRYQLVEQIGHGGMGIVYLVEDPALGRRIALKVLDVVAQADDLAGRLLQEARILAQLEHPGIVPVHDVGTLPDGRVFYAMKYVKGGRLDEYARALHSTPDRLRVFQKVCDAVAFAHSRGVLHRDLKPENIMIGPFGEVLVMDWGVAKLVADAGGKSPDVAPRGDDPEAGAEEHRRPDTQDGAVIGTPGYMSPEQVRGEASRTDERSDVYALGRILRFLLGGAVAEGGPALGGRVPAPLTAVCAKACEVEPDGRYASVAELAAEMARYLDDQPLEAYPDTLYRRIRRLLNRHQVAVLLVLAYLVARVVLIVFAGR